MFQQMLAGAQKIQSPQLIATAQFGLAQIAERDHAWDDAHSLALKSLEGFTQLGDAQRHRVSQWLATLPQFQSH